MKQKKDMAYLAIKSMILFNEIKQNSFISEEQLSQRLNMSRTPIREAFARLHFEQVLEAIPYRGVLVKAVSPTEVLEIYDTRSVLEKRSAHLFCINKRLTAPKRMYEIIDEMDRTTNATDLIILDLEFHNLIVESSNNQTLQGMYSILEVRKIQASLELFKKHTDNNVTEHQKILEALTNKNADLACQLLDQHFKKEIEILTS